MGSKKSPQYANQPMSKEPTSAAEAQSMAYDAYFISKGGQNITDGNARQAILNEAEKAGQQAAADYNAAYGAPAPAPAPAPSAAPTKSEAVKQVETLKGIETPEDVAAREKATLANPKKSKPRGRRSLVSAPSLGTGVSSTREQLG